MFSPCGKFVASGSFDKTARIWDIQNQHEATVLSGHSHSVSELTWSKDSQELLTGGFDKTVRLWDVTHAHVVKGYLTSGFVQAVSFHPTDSNIFFASNTHKNIIVFDRRQARCVAIFENDSMVNTMHVSKGGNHILSGDARGFLKVWDTRVALNATANVGNGSKVPARANLVENTDDSTNEGDGVVLGQCVDAEPNAPRPTQGGIVDSMDIGDSNKPISHLHVSKGNDSEGRYLAVNSYSNVLRVYDRGSGPLKTMALIGSFSSHKNQNWPIKSSFFVGKGYQSTLTQEEANTKDEDDEEDTTIDINASFLIATGSADNNAYIYDVGRSKEGGQLLQRLEGHTDKVYSVNFHPFEPIIVSSSSDFTVRLWSPRKKFILQCQVSSISSGSDS
jgi:COMPASS component SWD3